MNFQMKLLLFLLAILLLVISNLTHACSQNVKWTQTGTVLECDAWVVKDSQMQKFDKAVKSQEIYEKLNEANNQLLKLSEAEMEMYKRQSQSAHKRAEQAENKSYWVGIGAFALGVVLTGIAAKAAIEASK